MYLYLALDRLRLRRY